MTRPINSIKLFLFLLAATGWIRAEESGPRYLAANLAAADSSPAAKPNIILNYSDDHGWADLGAQGVDEDILADDLGVNDVSICGSKFHETPNIDALAKRGLKFNQACSASPLCSPPRNGTETRARVVECASPLALWGRATEKRRRAAASKTLTRPTTAPGRHERRRTRNRRRPVRGQLREMVWRLFLAGTGVHRNPRLEVEQRVAPNLRSLHQVK